MSIRYEWMHNPSVEYVPAGTELGEHVTDADAFVICGDECTVVTGNLRAFVERALDAFRAQEDENE